MKVWDRVLLEDGRCVVSAIKTSCLAAFRNVVGTWQGFFTLLMLECGTGLCEVGGGRVKGQQSSAVVKALCQKIISSY